MTIKTIDIEQLTTLTGGLLGGGGEGPGDLLSVPGGLLSKDVQDRLGRNRAAKRRCLAADRSTSFAGSRPSLTLRSAFAYVMLPRCQRPRTTSHVR